MINCPDSLKQTKAVTTVRREERRCAMCYSRRPCLKAPRPSPLMKSSVHCLCDSFPPSTSALRAPPGRQHAFLSFLLFQGRDQWCLYKSIGGSYLKLAGAYCDSVRRPVRRQHVTCVSLDCLSCLWCHQYLWRDKVHYAEMPSFTRSFFEAEHKARAEYEGI